ncbi:unnamed protein product [Cunninghamella blakesleeana]
MMKSKEIILFFLLYFLTPIINCNVIMRDNYAFVFIHGAMHGAWCYDKKLVPFFKENNYKTVTFDLPGCGDDYTPPEQVDLQSHIDKTLSVINENVKEDEKIILVAHSLGGLTATLVAERIPERIHHVVYLAAWYLHDGQALSDMPIRNHFYIRKDNDALMTMDDKYVANDFFNDCSKEDIEFAKSKLRDQPAGVTTEKMKVKGIINDVKKYYITTLQDHAIQPALQKTMYKDNIENVIRLNTSHSPFFSKPKELYEILIKTME